ncbi:phenylalanine--tRNA ligase subunit beta [Aurantibacter crassamenti]|uniref:phenylalanine--tRNA ligase subunit beta n=1 Tax=Aurantibacter crassamenti TaxID=1837375 RepID=UPI0019399640|nr:phenylalanine--tRNA ligase subunit beta [Aurantibacter crassamenti]MBM1107441.1 phenylalanine--tRNA ligase subunit beta [Aurantibacter crassamenti]
MKISYNWLKQFIPIEFDADQTSEMLTNLGLEVGGIENYESVKGGLKGVLVGHVLSCEKHPNADRLNLTTVDIGLDEPVQIVCGAPNVAKGQKVPVATLGTILYDEKGESWQIKKGKIRGEVSMGMICAADELGLGTDHDGIMVLDSKLKPGTPCSEIFEIENDEIFEIDLTPNRADAMSHLGVARDLQAGLERQKISKKLITPSVGKFHVDVRSRKLQVTVENSKLAPRYCGITLSNLTVQQSPDWLKNRLNSIGVSPINNVVDVTNYVLHELGQPLHAFDADRVYDKNIVVKTVEKGTKFMTLDGVEHILHEDDLMICDAEKPMCIAGVFGGINTGVTEKTTSIFLESAYFDPVTIRKTAKRHGLSTDASFRFERGIDIENVEYALKRAALLIKELTNGEITSDIVDFYPKQFEDHQVFLSFEKINKLIGEEIPKDTIKSILASLYIKVKSVTESGLGLAIPSFRVDVQREVDVIEEILRVYGYNNIKFGQKLNASIAQNSRFDDYKLEQKIGDHLTAQGFYEIMTNSLTSPSHKNLSKQLAEKESVQILNPLSGDLSVLRSSMLFTGLEAISYNINRKKSNLKFFEFGKTYIQGKKDTIENKHLALYLTGNRSEDSWATPQKKNDFFYLKTAVENILSRLGVSSDTSIPNESDLLSEGLTITHKKKNIVTLGIVSNSILKSIDIKQEVLYADFNWNNLIELVKENQIVFKAIPKYPEVKRDFALLLDDSVAFQEVYDLGINSNKKLIKNISLFDVYKGSKLPKGKKSYAVSFTLQDDKSTLTDKQIDKVMDKLQSRYKKELGAELR